MHRIVMHTSVLGAVRASIRIPMNLRVLHIFLVLVGCESTSINVMPAPEPVCCVIQISYKMFYTRFTD